VFKLLSKFEDILTNKLLKELSSKTIIDHKIELRPKIEPQNKAFHRLNQVNPKLNYKIFDERLFAP
jgi:hypothetical protein